MNHFDRVYERPKFYFKAPRYCTALYKVSVESLSNGDGDPEDNALPSKKRIYISLSNLATVPTCSVRQLVLELV